MSFLNILLNKIGSRKKTKKRNSLQAQSELNTNAYTDILKNSQCSKRMSPTLLYSVKGGVTVEAALAVPIFIFFMVNVISVISIFGMYSRGISEVQQTARTMAFTACDIGGSGPDTVTIVKNVPMKSAFSIIGFNSGTALASMTYRKWTGYNVGAGADSIVEEEYVYITERGYSYHRNRDCSHLKITVEAVTNTDIENKRNKSGARYYPCEKCGGNGSGILFITPDGNKYHSNAGCSGLKRNVKTVRLSEVGGRSPCSDCGG